MIACAHCGAPARAGPDGRAFCCAGCRAVHAALHEAGLDAYYRRRERLPEPARLDADVPSVDTLRACFVGPDGTARRDVLLGIDGIHCASCGFLIEHALRADPRVEAVAVSLGRATARVTIRPGEDGGHVLAGAITRLQRFGYRAGVGVGAPAETGLRSRRAEWIRLGVAAACAMNAMLYSVALYGGERYGIEARLRWMFEALSLALGTIVVFYCARPILKRAVAAVRCGRAHVDVPVSIAILVMYSASVVAFLRGGGAIWHDSLAMLVALLLSGRAVERAVHERAEARLAAMLLREGTGASRIDAATGLEERVQSSLLRVGDRVRVRVGEVAPVDLESIGTTVEIDAAVLDGEPLPREVHKSMAVPGGARVIRGVLTGRVTASAEASTVARVRAAVDASLARRTPEERLADRIGGAFVVVVLALGAGTAMLPVHETPADALAASIAVLIVACPCALALATPLAFAATVHAAAARGLLVRDGSVLMRLGRVRTVLFDKTGTLTGALPAAGAPELAPSYADGPNGLLRLAAAVAIASRHPVARAVVRRAELDGLFPLPAAEDVVEIPGVGIEGRAAGHQVAIRAPGATIFVDGVRAGHVATGDAERDGASEAVHALSSLSIHLGIRSGDEAARVDVIAHTLGIDDVAASLSPEAKVEAVLAARRNGPVCFVGDGLNDAEALARADVGIAMRGAVDVSLSGADGVLLGGALPALADGVVLGRRLRRTVRGNIAVSAAYNLFAVSLAAGDVSRLVAHLVKRLSRDLGRRVEGVDAAATALLEAYPWPGNVRELRNVLERALILCRGARIGPADLPPELRGAAASQPRVRATGFVLPEGGIDLAAVERDLVTQALERAGGNQSQAARLLGIGRYALRYRLEKMGG